MKTAQRGFGLIEVLITLVLTAIGILGVVAMQSKSIQFTQHSVNRNTASILASDLMETLRASRHEIYDANVTIKHDSGYLKRSGSDFSNAEEGCSASSAECPLAQLQAWKTRVQQQLPGVTDDLLKNEYHICISKAATGCAAGNDGSAIEIRLAWIGSNEECPITDGETLCSYTLRAEI